MTDPKPRASTQFIEELERHIKWFEQHLHEGGYAPMTVHTKAVTSPDWLLRYLRGETFKRRRQ